MGQSGSKTVLLGDATDNHGRRQRGEVFYSGQNDGSEEENVNDDDRDEYDDDNVDDGADEGFFMDDDDGNDDEFDPKLMGVGGSGDDVQSTDQSSSTVPVSLSHDPCDGTNRRVGTVTNRTATQPLLLGTTQYGTTYSATDPTTLLIEKFQDHYTLGESTTLRFRSRALRIFNDDSNRQLVLEQDPSPTAFHKRRNKTKAATKRRKQNTPQDDVEGGTRGGISQSSGSTTTSDPTTGSGVVVTVGHTAEAATMYMTHTSNFGMAFLRTIYTLVSLFVMTVIFCFNVQTILFLFMNLVGVETAQTWTTNPPTKSVLGATMAVPLLLYSSGSMMTMSWSFVVDCWNGISNEQSLFRQMVSWNAMVTEWVCFTIFLLVPLTAMALSTLLRNDDWWEISIASWAIAVGCFQIFYMLLVFVNEIKMCHALLQKFMPNIYDERNIPKWMKLVDTNILLTQRQKWSGQRYERYLVQGTDIPPPRGFSSDPRFVPVQWHLRLGTRLTLDGSCLIRSNRCNHRYYKVLTPPVRNYSMEEVFGNVMFLSHQNWSLERLWCMDRKRGAAITLTGVGPASVTTSQMTNAYVCIVAGSVLVLLVVAGLLTWAGQSAVSTFFVLFLVFVFCLFPMNLSSYLVYRFHRLHIATQTFQDMERGVEHDLLLVEEDLHQEPMEPAEQEGAKQQGHLQGQTPLNEEARSDKSIQTVHSHDMAESKIPSSDAQRHATKATRTGNESSSQPESTDKALISVWESVRVSEAHPWFCWATAGLEVSIFYLWPVISLSVTGNGPVAIVFGIVGAFSIVRHYFNVSNLLQELGPIHHLDLASADLEPAFCGLGGGAVVQLERSRKLRYQALVAGIVKRATRAKSTRNWIIVFFLLFLCVFAGFIMASTEESFDYKVKGVIFVSGFYYDPQPQLPYPTCSVQKGFTFPGIPGQSASLADYAFLATQAFSGPDEAQPNLDQWFGPGNVIDDYEFVDQYREATGTVSNPVSYKFFTFPSIPDAGIVSIRGSEAMWDWMVDMQLWAGGVLAQLIRAVNPFGYIWDSILDDVVVIIDSVQSQKLKEVSYYRYTSQFIEDMYAGFEGRQYQQLRVTGASLGGGLAILTGAITGASAVAISGLNAMYSRRTFDPPITAEQLNTRVFNVIPERDIIAHIDVPGMLYQRTQCRGPKNSLFGCHSMWRNLCEIQYQCGSGTRPINCWCVSKYGYPQPIQNGTVTWEEACADADS